MPIEPLSDLYREYAADEQRFATAARIPHLQFHHERSRDKWLELAARAEWGEDWLGHQPIIYGYD